MTDEKNPDTTAESKPQHLPAAFPIEELRRALIVLQAFVGEDPTRTPTPDVDTYKELRNTLIEAGINAESIRDAVSKFPILDMGSKDGSPFIHVDHPDTFTTAEGEIVAYTAFLDAILQGNFPLPIATMTRAKKIEYPIDNVNAKIWKLLEKDTAGQLAIKAEKTGSKKEINIFYAINFESLENDKNVTITKRLMPYDKRVYISASSLFNAGNEIITLSQIYYGMGYTGNPGKSDLKRINDAITKMMGARIYVNNSQEAETYSYSRFVYDGQLLPAERISAVVNGQPTEAAIHLFREPPVITFAKQRKQITTIEVKLLQSPISKTDSNLLIEDYLIERIAKAKAGTQPRRILYKTLCEKAKISTAKQKQRLPDKVKRYLDHYKYCGMISRYTMEADGITVYFSKANAKK